MTRPWASPFRFAAIAAVAAWGLVGAGNAHAQAYDWGAMAIVSGTMGINANQICIGEGTRGDIGCPTYAPSVTTAGLEVSGTVSATRFVGDGSSLTGIAANVSVTTGASGSLVFRDQFGSLFASSGLYISGTTTTFPGALTASSLTASGNIIATSGGFNGSSFYLPGWADAMSGSGTSHHLTFITSGTEAVRIVSTGYVGIGTINPSSSLHLAGAAPLLTITSTSSVQSVQLGVNDLKFNRPSGFSYIKNIASSGALAFIVSNSAAGGGLFLQPNNDSTQLSLGTSSPLANLHISGTALFTSSTAINLSRAALTPLEVNGTVSATRFVGDGSGLTGIAANVSVTTGASGSLVYRDAFGSLTASSTFNISSTNGSMGIGAGPPAGYGGYALYAAGNIATASNYYLGPTGQIFWGNATASVDGSDNQSSSYIRFTTSGTEAMRIVSTGLVGIGTTNPSSSLHVMGMIRTGGTGVSGALSLIDTSGVNYTVRPSGTALVITHNGGTPFNFKFAGPSGVGTRMAVNTDQADPSATLHVSGTAIFTSGTAINLNRVAVAPLEVSGIVSATRFVGDGSGLTGIASSPTVYDGASGSLVYRDAFGSLTASSGLSISSTTGSVGIGAGAPASVGSSGLYAAGTIQSAAAVRSPWFNPDPDAGLNWTSGSAQTRILGSAANPYLSFVTSNTEAMRIVSTGYVGIGITSPIYRLQVGSGGLGLGGNGSTAFMHLFATNNVYTGITASPNSLSIRNNAASGGYSYRFYGDSPTMVGVNFSTTPTAPLEVSGTVSATTLQLANGPTDACTTANGGALKRVGNRFYFCRP